MKKTKKILIISLLTLSIIGISFIGLIIHEGIHMIQSKEPQKICINIGEKNIAEVTAKDFNKNTEWYAYGIQIIITTIGTYIITKKAKENGI